MQRPPDFFGCERVVEDIRPTGIQDGIANRRRHAIHVDLYHLLSTKIVSSEGVSWARKI